MPDLIAEFQKFRRTYRSNPDVEKETTVFIRHLKDEGILGTYTDGDWLKLAEKLEMTDDEFGVMFEGTASWIIDEPIMPSKQEPADWPDEIPRASTVSSRPSPASNPSARHERNDSEEDEDEAEVGCSCEDGCKCDPCTCDACEECSLCLCCCSCEDEDDDCECCDDQNCETCEDCDHCSGCCCRCDDEEEE
jgi:hypothetical protein